MTRVINDEFLVVSTKYEEFLIDKKSVSFLYKKNNIFVFKLLVQLSDLQNFIDTYEIKVEIYLDKFVVLVPKTLKESDFFWEQFYEAFADEYMDLINVKGNLENIEYLIELNKKYSPLDKNSLVLDFACGIGLSSTINTDFKIMGYERSEKMRKIAHKNMTILNDEQFFDLPNNFFDAAFASYVFHLSCPDTVYELLWSKLKKGASLAVNFHKSKKIEYLNKFVEKNNGLIIKESPSLIMNKHGEYYVYVK